MNTYYYCKTKKSGKLTKPIKIVADNKDAAQKIIRDNNSGVDTLFFECMCEYTKLTQDINAEKVRKEKLKLDSLSENAKKVFEWICNNVGYNDLTIDAVNEYGLFENSDKEYYILCFEYDRGCYGEFITEGELKALYSKLIINNDRSYSRNILNIKTMKEVVPVIKEIEFKYKN